MAADATTLHIEQQTRAAGKHTIQLTLERPGEPKLTAKADIEFALTPQEHAELRWYLEDYLVRAESVTTEHVDQIAGWMKARGEELYRKVLRANDNTQDLWSSVRNHLAELRVEITTGVADAAAIPWELMVEPKSDSAIALRVKSFVRVQSDPNISFVKPPDCDELGRVRLLYVVCRPSGADDVELRAVVNQLLKEVGEDLDRFDITALRPPTYERLQRELTDAREAGQPYHIVHFDGHGVYADLEKTTLADWAALLSNVMLGADSKGKHGYLLFEHPDSRDKMRPVSGDQLDTIGQVAVPDWAAINQLDAKQQAVLAVLRRVPLLWIWDNVEPVAGFPEGTESSWTADEQRELADFLKLIKLDKATKAKVLLTSRRDEQRWLGGVPHRVQMPRMRNTDAARLALEMGAEKNLTRSEINSWQPLLDYCAGNPLTLRVIVGQAVRMGLRGEAQIAAFVQTVRDGEQQIEDADEAHGRDVSLGASLDYGFRSAFSEDELPIVALLHLFQGTVDVRALQIMGVGEHALPELAGRSAEQLTRLLNRCSEAALLTPLGGTWYTIHPALPWFLRQLFARHYPTQTQRRGDIQDVTLARDIQDVTLPRDIQDVTLPRDIQDVTLPPGGSRGTSGEGASTSSSDPATMMPTPSPAATASDPPAGRVKKAAGLADASGWDRQSTATNALRAWAEAVGELSNHYHIQFRGGNGDVIQFLSLEESNLLHARRVSRRHGWWSRVTGAMQGLHVLYQYQGRTAEWTRLVTEIVPDYCTADDGPIPGREEAYSPVVGYRVELARDHNRDLVQAAALQEKRVAWNRQHAAAALALPPDTKLDANQRNSIRTLGVSVLTLGQILMDQGSGDCVPAYEETVRHDQRIGDTAAEAIAHFNLGHAYKDLPEIRDLDAAESAYRRALALFDENDTRGRLACLKQIGMVHHERFRESRAASEPDETVLRHAQEAESHLHQSLALCPATAITDLAPSHGQLGNFYSDVGQTERAREHYEKSAHYSEQSGNRHMAGQTRRHLALMYLQSASREETPAGRETLLRRAQTYAAAALRDYQHYEGRAAAEEANAQRLIDDIQQQLT